MKEIEKVRRYERVNPGVDIPIEQKAERYDRQAIKQKYNGKVVRRRGSMPKDSFTMPDSQAWCKGCGKFKHEGDC